MPYEEILKVDWNQSWLLVSSSPSEDSSNVCVCEYQLKSNQQHLNQSMINIIGQCFKNIDWHLLDLCTLKIRFLEEEEYEQQQQQNNKRSL